MRNRDVAYRFSISKARELQREIAGNVIAEDRFTLEVKRVGGVDAVYDGDVAFGAATVVDYASLETLETQTATRTNLFPYIPTLRAFREIATFTDCINKLGIQPDIFLVNGHGRAHPYRAGLACHLGIALGVATIGVAKTILIGKPQKIGENTFLVDNGERVGAVILREDCKPLYVSVGHMVTLDTATKIVKHCIRSHRLPEPLWVAHHLAAGQRRILLA